MQLRPSGGAGPTAVSLEAFRRYYANDAWPWEKLALVKARTIAGDAAVRASVEAAIDAVIDAPRDVVAMVDDAEAMRARLRKEKPNRSMWDLKTAPGGMTELDFAVAMLALAHGADIGVERPLRRDQFFARLQAAGLLGADEGNDLLSADAKFEKVLQLQRASNGAREINMAADAVAMRQRVTTALGATDFDAAAAAIERSQAAVSRRYAAIVERLRNPGGAPSPAQQRRNDG